MGVTMTMPEGHAILVFVAAFNCIGDVAAARTAQAITASKETRLWPRHRGFSSVVMVSQWKLRLL